jgi:hypothetical protein
LTEFHLFLKELVRNYGTPGIGNVSYLSSSTYAKLINLLGTKVLDQIMSEIKEAK